jgi:hypothetical protein
MLNTPRLTAGCSFHAYDNGGAKEEYVLASGDGRQFKISALARRVLGRLDGRRTIDQITAELNDESIPVTSDQLRQMLEGTYLKLGVIEDGAAPPAPPVRTTARRRPGFPMLLALPLVPERAVAPVARWLRHLFLPAAALPLLALVAWAHAAVYTTAFDATALRPARSSSSPRGSPLARPRRGPRPSPRRAPPAAAR